MEDHHQYNTPAAAIGIGSLNASDSDHRPLLLFGSLHSFPTPSAFVIDARIEEMEDELLQKNNNNMAVILNSIQDNNNNNYDLNVLNANDGDGDAAGEDGEEDEGDGDEKNPTETLPTPTSEPTTTTTTTTAAARAEKTQRHKALDVPEGLLQALIRNEMKFANGAMVTEKDLHALTLSQFDQLVVSNSDLFNNSGSSSNNNNNNKNNNKNVGFDKSELKLWKALKKIVRNRKAAASSRNKRKHRMDIMEQEVEKSKEKISRILNGLKAIVSNRNCYKNTNNNNNDIDLVFQRLERIIADNNH